MTTTEVFQSGDGQVVRLPQGFEFSASEVTIRRDGESIIIEPIKVINWPNGFFEQICIDDPAFGRPDQGLMPVAFPINSP